MWTVFKELLRLYLYPKGRDRAGIAANLKRVEGIDDVSARPADTLVRGVLVRGQEITLTARKDHFASLGDLLLFRHGPWTGFFSEYSSLNSFTRLRVKEMISGETFCMAGKKRGEGP